MTLHVHSFKGSAHLAFSPWGKIHVVDSIIWQRRKWDLQGWGHSGSFVQAEAEWGLSSWGPFPVPRWRSAISHCGRCSSLPNPSHSDNSCSRLSNSHPNHVLIPGTNRHHLTWKKRLGRCDHEYWDKEIILDYLHGPHMPLQLSF